MGDANAEMRDLLLVDDPERETIEHKGFTVEVRAPTLKQQKTIRERAKDPKTKQVDDIKMLVFAVMECAYYPGSDSRVFKREDEEALMSHSLSPRSLMGKATKAIGRLMSQDAKEIEANFEEDPTDS